MLRIQRLAPQLLIAALTASCAGAEVKPAGRPKAREYYPLAVGNTWVFRVLPAPPEGDTLEVRILSRDADGFFVSNVGSRLVARTTGIFDGNRFLLEEPLEVGHKWIAVPSAATVERYEIVANGAEVVVPAGRFQGCVQVRIEQPLRAPDGATGRLIGLWSYAPGVGPVHFVQSVELDGRAEFKTAEYSLVRFDLAPEAEAPRG